MLTPLDLMNVRLSVWVSLLLPSLDALKPLVGIRLQLMLLKEAGEIRKRLSESFLVRWLLAMTQVQGSEAVRSRLSINLSLNGVVTNSEVGNGKKERNTYERLLGCSERVSL